MNAVQAYEQWDNFGLEKDQNLVDLVITAENKCQKTSEYRAEKKREDVEGVIVKYPTSKSRFSLYLERSV